MNTHHVDYLKKLFKCDSYDIVTLIFIIEAKLTKEQWHAYANELLNQALDLLDNHFPFLGTGDLEKDTRVLLLRQSCSISGKVDALYNIFHNEREV